MKNWREYWVLIHGYINFFEGECCFIGDAPGNIFRRLQPGDRVIPDSQTGARALTLDGGRWNLAGPGGAVVLQGLTARLELSPEEARAQESAPEK